MGKSVKETISKHLRQFAKDELKMGTIKASDLRKSGQGILIRERQRAVTK